MIMSIVCVMIRPKGSINAPATQIETQQPVPAGTPDMSTNIPANQGAQQTPPTTPEN